MGPLTRSLGLVIRRGTCHSCLRRIPVRRQLPFTSLPRRTFTATTTFLERRPVSNEGDGHDGNDSADVDAEIARLQDMIDKLEDKQAAIQLEDGEEEDEDEDDFDEDDLEDDDDDDEELDDEDEEVKRLLQQYKDLDDPNLDDTLFFNIDEGDDDQAPKTIDVPSSSVGDQGTEAPSKSSSSPSSSSSSSSSSPDDFASTLAPEDASVYNSLTSEEKAEYRAEIQSFEAKIADPSFNSRLVGEMGSAIGEVERKFPDLPESIEKFKPGFMAEGEDFDDPEEIGADDQVKTDDITSLGHGELEQHREIREYAKIVAWEMPLLANLARPFEPPSSNEPLRFRYTTYMGETHPAETKVVLEFCTRDLPTLTEAQRLKLIKLAGVRYNPSTDIVKMSSEMFRTRAKNKRYLGDLVDTLLREARDPTDMFEDVPLDFRHHREKKRFVFPEAWKMTPERRQYLDEKRRQKEESERERVERGLSVDGVATVQRSWAAIDEDAAKAAETVAVPVGAGRGKSGGREMRRR
ncbi:MAG: 37S ribosomal protein S24, mitochondrial [Caeruleum heppii]|nr:MAG: 37S ribosomal protein S24, mitochondrial [Caeruleum heppii]